MTKKVNRFKAVTKNNSRAFEWGNEETNYLIRLYNAGVNSSKVLATRMTNTFPDSPRVFTPRSITGKLNRLQNKSPELFHEGKHSDTINTRQPASDKQLGKLTKDGTAEYTNFDKKINKDGSEHFETTLEILQSEKLKDENFILKAFGYDPNKWRIIRNRSNFYQQGSNEVGVRTLWNVKIDVEPIGEAISFSDLADLVGKLDIKPINVEPKDTVNYATRNLVLSFADLHFGITTLDELEKYLTDLKKILASHNYKKIVIEQLGDLFHSDSFTTIRTAQNTLLSTDGKEVNMEQAVQDAVTFYETIITEALQTGQEVEIYHTQGNHSPALEYMFLCIMEAKFPNIKIHKNIKYRTAYKLDNVGILIAHGDTAKRSLPMLFANEYRDIWGSTSYREIHTGHYHKEVVQDENGVVTRQFGTPKPSDGYEQKNGYTMAHKKMQALEFNEDKLKVIYDLG